MRAGEYVRVIARSGSRPLRRQASGLNIAALRGRRINLPARDRWREKARANSPRDEKCSPLRGEKLKVAPSESFLRPMHSRATPRGKFGNGNN